MADGKEKLLQYMVDGWEDDAKQRLSLLIENVSTDLKEEGFQVIFHPLTKSSSGLYFIDDAWDAAHDAFGPDYLNNDLIIIPLKHDSSTPTKLHLQHSIVSQSGHQDAFDILKNGLGEDYVNWDLSNDSTIEVNLDSVL